MVENSFSLVNVYSQVLTYLETKKSAIKCLNNHISTSTSTS